MRVCFNASTNPYHAKARQRAADSTLTISRIQERLRGFIVSTARVTSMCSFQTWAPAIDNRMAAGRNHMATISLAP
jgi:hypothetical protein